MMINYPKRKLSNQFKAWNNPKYFVFLLPFYFHFYFEVGKNFYDLKNQRMLESLCRIIEWERERERQSMFKEEGYETQVAA